MEDLANFKQAQDKLRMLLSGMVGTEIRYQKGGHTMTGEIIEVNKYAHSPTLKVKSSTGKKYYIQWYQIDDD